MTRQVSSRELYVEITQLREELRQAKLDLEKFDYTVHYTVHLAAIHHGIALHSASRMRECQTAPGCNCPCARASGRGYVRACVCRDGG